MKKMILKIFLIIFLLILYIYILLITNLPSSIVVFEGENLNLASLLGLQFSLISNEETIEVSSNNSTQVTEKVGKSNLKVSLFNNVVKNLEVDVLPRKTVIPVGNIAGVKLYTNGVLVVGMSEIEGEDNKKYKPYANTGIEEGDTIISINNTEILNTDDLVNIVNSSNGNKLDIKYVRDNQSLECSITPVKTIENDYKLGLWVRDSAAGVGTVTFYEPSTKSFAALGHGIVDIDTEELINIASGEFVTTKILNITKGESGNPGRIQGTIDNQENIGIISKNTRFGIYGKVDDTHSLNIDYTKEMEVALRSEIQKGKATILCSLDNEKVKEYEIEIEKIYVNNNYDNKSMLIKITDQELLEKTGGIIQGMSGSPIIQNGKFVGAITNVLVNNPEEGYAVFGDIMLKQMMET